ncbi:MAG: alpha/beta hydrolase domain-containing protein, partial [Sphingomonas sp.]
PLNTGQAHHYGAQAALNSLERWVRSGRPPASTQPLTLATGGSDGVVPSLALDANGLARGGVRTPWVDVPTTALSGKGDPSDFLSMLAGTAVPFDAAKLAMLYPGGKADYLRKFTRALDEAIAKGHILSDDRAEILAIAAINFDAVSSAPK